MNTKKAKLFLDFVKTMAIICAVVLTFSACSSSTDNVQNTNFEYESSHIENSQSSYSSSYQSNFSIDISYDPTGISEFLSGVLENVDAESAYIESIDNDNDVQYIATISIKPVGKVAENIELCFTNFNASDKVALLFIDIYEKDIIYQSNTYNCQISLCEALEKTIMGDTEISDYSKEFPDIFKGTKTWENDVIKYFVNDNSEVAVAFGNTYMRYSNININAYSDVSNENGLYY